MGTAMRPTTPHVNVIAPVTGRVSTIFPHAFALDTPDGVQILVHLGIDTISLHGDGFTLHHNQGDTVTQGELMITWDTTPALAAGLDLACPILAVQHPRDALYLENVPRDPHQPVTQGVPSFTSTNLHSVLCKSEATVTELLTDRTTKLTGNRPLHRGRRLQRHTE